MKVQIPRIIVMSLLLLLVCYVSYNPLEGFFSSANVPTDVYPGSLWRNNTYRKKEDCCVDRTKKNPYGCRPPEGIDVDYQAYVQSPSSFGQNCAEYKRMPLRQTEPRYELECDVDEHLIRRCSWQKIYNNFE